MSPTASDRQHRKFFLILRDFFEREQERLHNGEVAACIPGSSKHVTEVNVSQADIVSELIAKSKNKPMIDSDAPPIPERRSHNNGAMKNGKEKSENNPFNFEHNRSLKLSKPSKLASENFLLTTTLFFTQHYIMILYAGLYLLSLAKKEGCFNFLLDPALWVSSASLIFFTKPK